MSKKPINVYWAPNYIIDESDDWSFMYLKPETLLSNVLKNKSKNIDKKSFLSCPSVNSKFKKTLVFKNSVNCSYFYESNNNIYTMNPTTEQFIATNINRPETLTNGPLVEFGFKNIFFSDESLEMVISPPFFHEPKYTKYGSMVPGEFDIGEWFRPVNFEVQMWNSSGNFILEENEPIFYLEFKTKKPILFHRFNLNKTLLSYSRANVNYQDLFGKNIPLLEKYNKFKQVGFREKILTEIKKNLIDEEPYKF
jgi:hypothetical protein